MDDLVYEAFRRQGFSNLNNRSTEKYFARESLDRQQEVLLELDSYVQIFLGILFLPSSYIPESGSLAAQ
jgi:hypothetical protein